MANKTSLMIELEKHKQYIAELEEKVRKNQKNTNTLFNEQNVINAQVRDFCIRYLSGDNEIRDDKKASEWEKLSIPEMLARTGNALDSKTSFWVNTLNSLLTQNEELDRKYKALVKGVEEKRGKGILSEDDLKKIQESAESAEKQPQDTRRRGAAVVVNAHDEPSILPKDLQEHNMVLKEAVVAGSAPIVESITRAVRKEEEKEKIQKLPDEQMRKREEELIKLDWAIILVIGKYGTSVYNDMVYKTLELVGTTSSRQIRNRAQLLHQLGILEMSTVETSKTKFMAFKLTSEGKSLYYTKTGEKPVKSEWEKLVAEHTTLNHGYGIKDICDNLEGNGYFTSVSMYNRNKPIVLSQESRFVPDLLCEGADNKVMYIEYELHNETNTDTSRFSAKMNKFMEAVKGKGGKINFVVKNLDEANAIWKRINDWLDGKPPQAMKGYTIRITTAHHTKGEVNLWENSAWKYIMQPSASREIKTNF